MITGSYDILNASIKLGFFALVRYSLQMAKTRLERFQSSGAALPRKHSLMPITLASHVSPLNNYFFS